MPPAAQRWIAGLPWRWAFGGFVVGLLWVTLSIGITGGFSSPHGGFDVTFVRVAAWFVVPIAVLGGVWGLSERWKLRTAAASAFDLDAAARGFLPRQIVKSMICGLVFAAFFYGLGPIRGFHPWTSEVAILDNLSKLLGFAVFALPVGFVVGLVAGRGLKRRLAVTHETAAVF